MNSGILSKFKVLERHCGMDINGKIAPKQQHIQQTYYEHSKNGIDSQHTISMYDK